MLYDLSNNDQVEIGRFEATGDAGPPYSFTIDYADQDVTQGGLYSIATEVIWPDRAFVAAGTILDGFPAVTPELNLVMVRPGLSPAATPLDAMEQDVQMIGAHGLALPATFAGVVEGSAGEETWRIALAADQTFHLSRTFESSARDSLKRYAKNLNHLTLPEIKDFGRVT